MAPRTKTDKFIEWANKVALPDHRTAYVWLCPICKEDLLGGYLWVIFDPDLREDIKPRALAGGSLAGFRIKISGHIRKAHPFEWDIMKTQRKLEKKHV